MRRAQLFTSGNTIISLVMATVVILLFWGLASHDAFSGELFKEAVYATDNALLAEAVQIPAFGTMRYAYLLDNPNYQLVFEQGRFGVISEIRSGVPTSIQFAFSEHREVIPVTFRPRMYEVIATPTTLSLGTVLEAHECPIPFEQPMWPDVIRTAGNPLASIILQEALYDIRDPDRFLYQTALSNQAELTVYMTQTPPRIVHDRTQASRTIACHLQQQLAQHNISALVQASPTVATSRIILEVPQDREQDVREAAVCAYRRYATGGQHEC